MDIKKKPLNHALIITAYKNYEQLYKYVSYYVNYFDVYMHIDLKSTITNDELKALQEISCRIMIIKKYKINWGSYEHILEILELLYLAKSSPNQYDYFHIISGDDFMIKSSSKFEAFLKLILAIVLSN